jgi:hypothetical protein
LVCNEVVVTVHGIEVDGDFKEAVIEALAMNDLPYTVRLHKSKHRDAEQWCRRRLGERWSVIGNRQGLWACFWSGREKIGYYDFHFAREQDMIWVALKWQ